MLLLSKMLGHDRITCIAHGIHLLLTVDSVCKEKEVESLLIRCKDIVKTLHFKGYMISAEEIKEEDVKLFDKVVNLHNELIADEDWPFMETSTETTLPTSSENDVEKVQHKHKILKASMPTRWNSTLTMIESILDLRHPVREVLKKLGKSDMILDKEDFDLLDQLRQFLKPFNDITKLLSENSPNLALIPLIRTSIKKTCQANQSDLPAIKRVKKNVTQHIDKRIPVNQLVKISAALDPSVRDIVMSREDSYKLLEETYTNLYESSNGERIFSSLDNETENNDTDQATTTPQLPVQLLFQLHLTSQTAIANEMCLTRRK